MQKTAVGKDQNGSFHVCVYEYLARMVHKEPDNTLNHRSSIQEQQMLQTYDKPRFQYRSTFHPIRQPLFRE